MSFHPPPIYVDTQRLQLLEKNVEILYTFKKVKIVKSGAKCLSSDGNDISKTSFCFPPVLLLESVFIQAGPINSKCFRAKNRLSHKFWDFCLFSVWSEVGNGNSMSQALLVKIIPQSTPKENEFVRLALWNITVTVQQQDFYLLFQHFRPAASSPCQPGARSKGTLYSTVQVSKGNLEFALGFRHKTRNILFFLA